MKIFLYAISFIWVAAGSCLILYTTESRRLARQMLEEFNIKIMAVAGMIFCVCLLIAAPAASNSWFIVLLGLMGLIKGGLFIVNPQNIFETTRDWYLNKATDQTFRFFGIMMLVIGTAVFSWV
jgi:uncharacterized protein YjeT (DUF2065 family)